ncbi:unnamed protein product [Closterium sp. NIES-53]
MKMTSLRVLLHLAAQRDYELHSLDFSTAILYPVEPLAASLRSPPGTDTSLPPFYVPVYVDDLVFATADTEALTLVKSEVQKRHTCTDLGELRSYLGLQITQDRARHTITLTHSHMVHQVLQHFGFLFSSPQPTPLSTGHSLSAPPSVESVKPSGPYPELVGCLITLGMGLVLGGRGPIVLTSHVDTSWVDDSATQRSSQGYTFSLGSGSVSWRSTRLSSILTSRCEAEIYAGAMATQELRWLTYLLTDLGEQPRSPPVLYVDNKAMIALFQEHRLEHRMKHIALRYFLARELQQRGQLRLAYMATRANTADIFTKALPPGDHQRFSTVLGLCDASSLFTVLMSHLDSVGVNINRVSVVGTDGASVMMGDKGGLVFRLRERVPYLVGCHCVAHRLCRWYRGLDAAKAFPDLNMIDEGVDITQVAKEVDCTITIITHRYIEYGETFGGGVSNQLSRFIKDHGGENWTLVVEGIDGDGRSTSHRFELSEKPIKKHKFGGTLADSVKLCTGFAKETVARMKFRMWDLQQMGGAKLFQVESWPSREDQREIKFLDWLAQNDELFGSMLPGFNFKAAKKELRSFCHILARHHVGEDFHQGLYSMLKSRDWRRSYLNLMTLWQALAVLPMSIVECERGFSHQNIIKI